MSALNAAGEKYAAIQGQAVGTVLELGQIAVLIRAGTYASDDSCTCDFEGLPTITLGEIKWCREISDAVFPSYEVGIKYYGPDY